MKVVLRKLAQANRQTNLIGSAVIEYELIPGKKQYVGGLAAGLTPGQGNGLYYLTIGKNTNTTTWVEGEIIDVLTENGNFTTELGAEVLSVAQRQGNVLLGTVSFEMQKQTILLEGLLKAGLITAEVYAQKMNNLVDTATADAKAKIEKKLEATRVNNPVSTRRDRRSNLDLSIFDVTEGTENLNPAKAEKAKA